MMLQPCLHVAMMAALTVSDLKMLPMADCTSFATAFAHAALSRRPESGRLLSTAESLSVISAACESLLQSVNTELPCRALL